MVGQPEREEIMSIRTKTGDDGNTSLLGGERVSKDDPRIEANGALDELDSHLAETAILLTNDVLKDMIIDIQKTLKKLMSQIADPSREYIGSLDVAHLEAMLYSDIFADLHRIGNFVLQRGTLSAAKLDICRTITRRAERRVVSMASKYGVSEYVLSYLNCLSDLLFMMGRVAG